MARHPLHPALVHFPVACWSLGVAADVASLRIGAAAWHWSAGLFAVGCLMALPAMLAGLAELPRIPEGPALRDTLAHMAAMLTAMSAFSARLLLRVDQFQALPPDSLSWMLNSCGFLALAIGGWLGGRLVYGHGVGRV